MIEGRERLRLAQKPGAPGVAGGAQMHADRHRTFQHAVPPMIERALGGQRDQVVEPESRLERASRLVE